MAGHGAPRPTGGIEPANELDLGWLRNVRFVARILATVELERALVEHGLDPQLARAAVDDPLLGARAVLVEPHRDGPERYDAIESGREPDFLVIAEPSTEGRLAAVLARHDEGPAGRYLAPSGGLDAARRLAAASGVRLSRPALGPFGASALVLGGPLGGEIVVLLDEAAVPSGP